MDELIADLRAGIKELREELEAACPELNDIIEASTKLGLVVD